MLPLVAPPTSSVRTLCTPWWATGMPVQHRPRILATSVDGAKEEAQGVDPDTDLKDGPARFLGLAGELERFSPDSQSWLAIHRLLVRCRRSLPAARLSGVCARHVRNSYAYVLADVGFAVYGEHNRSAEKEDYEQRVARAGVETLTFQLLASIAVPSLIIHTAVHQAPEVAKKAAASPQNWHDMALPPWDSPLFPCCRSLSITPLNT